jgi:hypothetical protein
MVEPEVKNRIGACFGSAGLAALPQKGGCRQSREYVNVTCAWSVTDLTQVGLPAPPHVGETQ